MRGKKSCIILFLLLSFLGQITASGNEIGFHKVKARDGDGVIKLLTRYEVYAQECNVDKFYSLNNMKQGQSLLRGQAYFLPVVLFTYDGKSIRSTIGEDNWDKASRIAAFNRKLRENGLRKSTYQASRILWVPYHELGCAAELSPGSDIPKAASVSTRKTVLIEPVFGEHYEKVTIRTDRLSGKVYYIVSGHGGPDPGAMATVGSTSLCEDEYAYDVSLRLARLLMEQGATVHILIQDPNDGIRSGKYLDCDRDETCHGEEEIPLDQLARLRQRVFKINKLHEDYLQEGIDDHTVLCIHVDSRSPKKRQDVFFYYYGKSNSGKKLANQLHRTFRDKYRKYRSSGEYHGTVSERGLYTLRFTNPTAVYVELANIKNAVDRLRLLPEHNRQALANWLFEGLVLAR